MSGFFSAPGQAKAFMGSGAAPSVATQAALGTNGTATVEGNNAAGKITFVVGGANIATGKILGLTFAENMQFPTGATVNDMAGNDNYAAAITPPLVLSCIPSLLKLVLICMFVVWRLVLERI